VETTEQTALTLTVCEVFGSLLPNSVVLPSCFHFGKCSYLLQLPNEIGNLTNAITTYSERRKRKYLKHKRRYFEYKISHIFVKPASANTMHSLAHSDTCFLGSQHRA